MCLPLPLGIREPRCAPGLADPEDVSPLTADLCRPLPAPTPRMSRFGARELADAVRPFLLEGN
ncbi:MAG: hypothetical protein ACU4EQ_01350 [Candidatus Nitrosoglobus sp.]